MPALCTSESVCSYSVSTGTLSSGRPPKLSSTLHLISPVRILKSFQKIKIIMHTLQLILTTLPLVLVSALIPINIERRAACPTGYVEHSRAPCVLTCHSVGGDKTVRIVLDCIETSDSKGSSGLVTSKWRYDWATWCMGLMCHN
ncbi:hypothetical protein Hypma_008942 [Hypsizygus marmoreus]|uniref:Uncharacterized protein n=1 Tax=Hypsizygus marmoreus TaxID=39966 RepID=A0A369JRJ2_HYPMA|nr:hypothetical protein Hypma_008942 [Hypsizygus marmoreus]